MQSKILENKVGLLKERLQNRKKMREKIAKDDTILPLNRLEIRSNLKKTQIGRQKQSEITLFCLLDLWVLRKSWVSFVVVGRSELSVEATMASFQGTQQKCSACDKTVYLVDKLTADNRIFHKSCFRCHHCRGTPKIVKPERQMDNENAIKVSNMFEGTREKCKCCNKTAYPIERVTVNRTIYHKSCFKCIHGGCTISPSNYIAHEGKLYCKHHHIQLFREKGNYSQLETNDESLIYFIYNVWIKHISSLRARNLHRNFSTNCCISLLIGLAPNQKFNSFLVSGNKWEG
ncbi:hypothetical protein GQ457_17G003480 [Hibiscus cannabinus]